MSDIKITTLTENPYEELKKVATNHAIEAKNLDFMILGFSTSYTNDDVEWKKISEKELNIFEDNAFFLNPNLKIKQEYKIQIYKKNNNYAKNSKHIELVVNEDHTELKALLQVKNLVIDEYLGMDILQNIYKKMLKKSLFIGVRVFDFKQQVLSLVKSLKEQGAKEEQVSIIVAKGVLPTPPENEKLYLTYKHTMAEKTGTPINQISIVGVDENELVLTLIKEKLAQNGRGLNLNFITNEATLENHKIEYSCTENLEAKESEEKIEYFAKKKGFVLEENHKFDIANTLDFSSVNFKSNGFIYAGLDKNVTINIINTSSMEEAVNSGVLIECENLNINGSVAQNTTLKATNLKLIGSTHTKSKIYAKNSHISTHRGYLEGEEADFDILENGQVQVKILRTKKALGGNIKAEKAYINDLNSNNTTEFTQLVVIDRCSGNNNKFLAQSIVQDDESEKQLEEIAQRQKAIPALINSLEQVINSSSEGIEILNKKIQRMQEQNQTIPPNYTQMIKKFQSYQDELKSLQDENQNLQNKKQEIHDKLQGIGLEILNAKIINKDGVWSDLNEVKFKLAYPKSELSYSTQKDEQIKCFSLVKNEDDEIKLQKSNEFDEKDIQ
ncbi:DUF342 domain-containing protein [Campylobacter sp. MIT 99-7217]|uniref:DUF342 domain-containing protein n=1 Tax=Campylobacter sp. MIT 99-7217 TaxID=535091 RepID=UPI00115AEFC2|nr:DUF342 domain-containing protein [Campylobacter sp. MIT 99-7217]TQR34634.1 DUF342 domain-containing protein [Campylobacter sp. MIT 99-7217]